MFNTSESNKVLMKICLEFVYLLALSYEVKYLLVILLYIDLRPGRVVKIGNAAV